MELYWQPAPRMALEQPPADRFLRRMGPYSPQESRRSHLPKAGCRFGQTTNETRSTVAMVAVVGKIFLAVLNHHSWEPGVPFRAAREPFAQLES